MNLFQTSLYVFSSLLQADAAILGFGAIFIIYKIQSIENVRQNILQTYYSQGGAYISMINTLLLGDSPAIAALLDKLREPHNFENFKCIACIPAKARRIGDSIKMPIVIIGGHTVFSGVFLYLTQFLSGFMWIQNSLLAISLLWFALAIYCASKLAIDLLIRQDEYKIDELRPDIFEHVVNKQDPKWSNG